VKALVDLHNHSCLSPCASLEESPGLLARLARERGLDLVALTDHNSALNCPAFAEACSREGIAPLFGIEANSVEEVHVLCLFGAVDEALSFGEFLHGFLPDLPYDPDKLGDQVVVDADELVLDQLDYYLGAALSLGFDEVCAQAASRGALVIPAHVDRPMFSVSSQLGFLPPGGPYDAVESIREPAPRLRLGLAAISGSDSHYPEHVARRPTLVELPDGALDPSSSPGLVEALRAALRAGLVRPSWAAAADSLRAEGSSP
jgi:3',5'-nucleoside bisphosphate phosphatase